MRKMPVFCTDAQVNERILNICDRFQNYFSPVFFDDAGKALEYLKYELPEINVVNFSDKRLDTSRVLETIKGDPWLHYGGIIGIHLRKDRKNVAEQMPDSNIISLIPRGEFVSSFYRVLKILIQNRQILFQRDLQNYLLQTISGSFVMDNDPFNVRTYANLVTNYLYNMNAINQDRKERLHVSLFELLMNAVEHGNCDISYEEKTKWLEKHDTILDLIREKCRDPKVRAKRVFFSYRITAERSYYTIRDEGAGFNWRERIEDLESGVNLSLHGHGIRMTQHYVDNLRYNAKGNEVSFELDHQRREANVVPGVFADQEEVIVQAGDVVFREGEESNFLYYIVSGHFNIYSSNKLVSSLSPDDIFLGEMSFLLNNRRSATVVSQGSGTLIKISKNDFVSVIKQNPHYGIFLARLLAQRLSRLNAHVASLQKNVDLPLEVEART